MTNKSPPTEISAKTIQWTVDTLDLNGKREQMIISAVDAEQAIAQATRQKPDCRIVGLQERPSCSPFAGRKLASLVSETVLGEGATVVVDDFCVPAGHTEILIGWPQLEIGNTLVLDIGITPPARHGGKASVTVQELNQELSTISLTRHEGELVLNAKWVFSLNAEPVGKPVAATVQIASSPLAAA